SPNGNPFLARRSRQGSQNPPTSYPRARWLNKQCLRAPPRKDGDQTQWSSKSGRTRRCTMNLHSNCAPMSNRTKISKETPCARNLTLKNVFQVGGRRAQDRSRNCWRLTGNTRRLPLPTAFIQICPRSTSWPSIFRAMPGERHMGPLRGPPGRNPQCAYGNATNPNWRSLLGPVSRTKLDARARGEADYRTQQLRAFGLSRDLPPQLS